MTHRKPGILLIRTLKTAAILMTAGLLTLYFITSCQNRKEPRRVVLNPEKIKEPLINANRNLSRTENEDIADFANRYGWNLSVTGSGLRYMIYRHGSGMAARVGKDLKVSFGIRLLNGDLCYKPTTKEIRGFEPGNSGLTRGMEEGILLLRAGDKAKLIVPSHLAFGLTGDQDRIPPRATLVYDLELLEVK